MHMNHQSSLTSLQLEQHITIALTQRIAEIYATVIKYIDGNYIFI